MDNSNRIIGNLERLREEIRTGEIKSSSASFVLRRMDWVSSAIALLKAQEPRVMTLEDTRVIYHRLEDHVWPFDTPPYLWVETNGRTVPYWMS